MKEQIQHQLNLIEDSLHWIKSSLDGEKQHRAYRLLRDTRRQLKKKKNSAEYFPAAAAYGESQVGKSYLMSALLSKNGEPFTIDSADGKKYNFKEDINPIGRGVESTSVVTRFTVNEEIVFPDFPIVAELLSPTDLILLICEAYYNNLNADTPPSYEQLKEKVEEIALKYKDQPDQFYFINEDDILDIQDYFKENFSKLLYNNIQDVKFFEKVSLIVNRIPVEEWRNVFPILWNNSPGLTKLYSDLIIQFEKINFVQKVYLPVESVLRRYGTLLDVARLNEIYGDEKETRAEYKSTTDLKYFESEDKAMIKASFPKSYLCALISELVFVLPKDLANDKKFLNNIDLLDFPGTRRFEDSEENRLNDQELTILLRRGKVDYLFNKYSRDSKINSLLFCQNHIQSTVSVMPTKLDKWVRQMVGDDPRKREDFKTEVAPLFIICTWFNVDLQFDLNNDEPGNSESLTNRWKQRFETVLTDEVIKSSTFSWFKNWTISNPNFQNIYLLRDFYQSSEIVGHIYKGYNEVDKKEKEEIIPKEYPEFRTDLKRSFLNHEFVKAHFKDPENSWNSAASINEDGAELILKNLERASVKLSTARNEKLLNEILELREDTVRELQRYYHNEDKDIQLEKARSRAGEIQWKMTMAFKGEDIGLYGKMMQELMINERLVYAVFREKIDDIESRQMENRDKYSTILLDVPGLSPSLSREENLALIFKRYEKNTPEQQQAFLEELIRNEIYLDELFEAPEDRVKSFSKQLAQVITDYWLEYILTKDKKILKTVFSDGALEDIVDMFQRLFIQRNLTEVIAEKIRRYVDGYNQVEKAYEMIADFTAEIINRFVLSVGMDFIAEADRDDIKKANKENNLGLIFEEEEIQGVVTHDDIAELFHSIDHFPQLVRNGAEALKTLPNFKNYHYWSNKLKIGFISVCDIPNYDLASNAELGRIIEQLADITIE